MSELSYDWSKIEQGTTVEVVGKRGTFVFRRIDKNGDVEVHGGSNGRAMFRTFHAGRITIKGHRRTKKGSSDE